MTEPTEKMREAAREIVRTLLWAGDGPVAFGGEPDTSRTQYVTDVLASQAEADRAEIARLEKLVYVPGMWKCAKCNFVLMQANLNAQDGSVTARDQPGDKCPNCNGPLWRRTEREAGNELVDRCEEQIALRKAAEARAEAAEARVVEMREACAQVCITQAHRLSANAKETENEDERRELLSESVSVWDCVAQIRALPLPGEPTRRTRLLEVVRSEQARAAIDDPEDFSSDLRDRLDTIADVLREALAAFPEPKEGGYDHDRIKELHELGASDVDGTPDDQSIIEPLWVGRKGVVLAAIVKDNADKVIGFCWLEPVHRNYGGNAMYNFTYHSDDGAWIGATADSFAAAVLAVRGHAGFEMGPYSFPKTWWQRVDELSVDDRRQMLLLPSERHWEVREKELEHARDEIDRLEAENARLRICAPMTLPLRPQDKEP